MSNLAEDQPPRQRALLPLTPSVLVSMLLSLQAGHRLSVAGLPEDTEALTGQYDWRTDQVLLVLQSESFEAFPEGSQLPFINVVIIDHGEAVSEDG